MADDSPDDPLDWPGRGLSARSKRIALAATEAILADENDAGELVGARPDLCERGVDALDHSIGRSSADVRRGFGVLTFVLEWLPLFIVGAPSRMSRLPLARRIAYFEKLESSKIGLLAMLFVAFKVPICIPAFEEQPELFDTGFESTFGFGEAETAGLARDRGGIVTREIGSAASIVHGRELATGFDEDCDVVIVGSGAGGAVTATLLAEAGLRVIVLEEGPYYRPSDYQRFKPSESVRRLFRESGLLTAFGVGQTPIISITLGRAVGGSSLLTGGVCFRIPSDVHHKWVSDLGLEELSERSLEAAYDEVERRASVREVPESMRSLGTRKFVEGAAKLGIEMHPLRRNTGDECEGNARCNFTCPAGAKKSVDVAYLPSAVAHGARIVSDAIVESILVENGRAAGISGRLLGGEQGAPTHRFTVRAPVVVSACGTLHTPLLLLGAGLGRSTKVLGRNITLHPAVRIVARFDDRVDGWNGALQSVYSDHFASEGIKLVGVYSSPNVLAAGFPGVGPTLRKHVRDLPYCGVFGGMIHDEGGGTVRQGPSREPLLTYEMASRDLARIRRSITILCEMAMAAGAREVMTPVFGFAPVTSMDQAFAMERTSYDARRIECMAFHPLGSARASNDARRGVVDQNGECFELPGLFVADGSILPTSIGVNSQVPIMAMATRIAWRLAERFPKIARQAAAAQ